VAKMKRVVEVEGQFVVMVDRDSLPVADSLQNEYEACAVALLISMGTYRDRRVFIAFVPNDSEDADDIVPDTDRFWYNGIEYQVGDDLNDPAERLLWYARYGYAQNQVDAGQASPGEVWAPATPTVYNAMVKWLLEVARTHEVAQLLPDGAIEFRDEGANRSGDRYHISLMRDIVRDPNAHRLDDSEKKGMLDTLERLMEQAGLE
jgi:hypothetical protein